MNGPRTAREALIAEVLGDLGLADRRILHHVMQQRGGDGLRVHAPFGQRAGNGERMGDIGFAGKALLPLVCLVAEAIGIENEGDLFRFEITEGVYKDPVGRIFEFVLGTCQDRRGRRSGRLRGIVRGLVRGTGSHDRHHASRQPRDLIRRGRG